MLNNAIHYVEGRLCVDAVPAADIAAQTDTPVYIYSLSRVLENYQQIARTFADMNAVVHYSAKANANLALLKVLVHAGSGIDAVSGGEIYKALTAGCAPDQIVFAGVGKTKDELHFALDQGIGWFNVENLEELRLLDSLAGERGKPARVALRLNPDIAASTMPQIATGHGGAKFGMSADAVRDIIATRDRYSHLHLKGIHVHIGSQLGDVNATRKAIRLARELADAHDGIDTLNIGGGFPVAYRPDQKLPPLAEFAAILKPITRGYSVILEPGRSVVADAGILVTKILYTKKQGTLRFAIVDAGMTELLRPALYGSHHEIVPLIDQPGNETILDYQVVGPVCESTDKLSSSAYLPAVRSGDLVAVLTAGAYGMVMASNYNARLRPPEVVVDLNGETWRTARRRETYEDIITGEMA